MSVELGIQIFIAICIVGIAIALHRLPTPPARFDSQGKERLPL